MKAQLVRLAALTAAAVALAGGARAQVPESDFQAGDPILLQVEGEQQFTGTFTVVPGPALVLPVVGEIPLAGVRRADIASYLAQRLGHYFKSTPIHARALVRLSILGEVEHPGFYAVPAEAVLPDAMMAAGGPTREAKFVGARIERDGAPLWAGERLQQAVARGMTIDQMRLHSGDQIFVPRLVRHDPESTWRIVGILVTLPAAVYGITRLF
jgi:protein involved in polysaccharide export with SLBB domain